MWRKISLALVTLVALAGLAAGVVLHLSKDEGFLKDRARAAVWRTTGRELAVDGQQSQPHLTASLQGRDIRIGLAAAKDQSPETCPPMELDKARAVMSGGAAVVTSGLSLLAKSFSDRFLGSDDPCGEARRTLAERDARSD
jgi:hypothetical protein